MPQKWHLTALQLNQRSPRDRLSYFISFFVKRPLHVTSATVHRISGHDVFAYRFLGEMLGRDDLYLARLYIIFGNDIPRPASGY